MADMFLEPIVEKLISAGLRYLKDQVTWHKRTKEELEKLKSNLPQIEAVVHFASSQDQITNQNQALNTWIWQLRDAIDDANDALDELEYMELEKQVTEDKNLTTDEEQLTQDKKLRRVRSIMKSMKKRFIKIGKRALKIDPILKLLEDAAHELCRLSTNFASFLHLVKDAKLEHQGQQIELYRARETGSLPKNDLIGRGKEKEIVMEWLRNPSNEHEHQGTTLYDNISLLSIVGHGGMGKTTLLQHIYKDEISKEFDRKMWVCVSNKFDVKKVIADMFESLKKEKPHLDTLDALQGRLKEELMAKKFLLVLDDVWEEEDELDKSKWEDVLAPLAYGAFGSKILITTRTDSVALMFANAIKKKKEIVKIDGLEEDDCLQLLNSHAFAGVQNPQDHENLRVIARNIVKKLLRSPLAAKVIGGVLYSLDLDETRWREVLQSNLLARNSINSILTLSYIVLPNHLRNCFAICCMFPQDHEFGKNDLVRMWIALGFIQPSLDPETTMEDIGRRYFHVLVKKALIDKVGDGYKMHDLLHESASIFFAQECGKLVHDEESSHKIPHTVRHLSVQATNPNILRKIEKFKHLHSLFLFDETTSDQDLCNGLIEIFKSSRSLRILYIHSWSALETIPSEIEYLKHLRYLKIERIFLNRLPKSLGKLYQLQYIIYDRDFVGRNFFPSDINNLSNLRHLKLYSNDKLISSIREIGKLKSLQKLKVFNLRNKSGYRIGELENMNDLCKLGICCLENVKDDMEARKAQLSEKRRLAHLMLAWSDTNSRNINLDENVLDNLQPSKCLRLLGIEGYMGARSAIWMNNVSPIFNLEGIYLGDCKEWETLPPFGQLPFLKSLSLQNMPKVKCLESKFYGNDKHRAFPLLEELSICRLEALEDWFEARVAAEDGCLFPCLIQLSLHNCPKLKELPSLPSNLKSLQIENIGWTTLNFQSNSNPIPLGTLEVFDCPNITSLPLADEIERLAALRYLKIKNCPNLISLGRYREGHLMLSDLIISDPSVLLIEPLRSISSVKRLIIYFNNEMVSFSNELEQWFLNDRSSLSELKFYHLKSLQSLPSCLESLSALQELVINNAPMLRELPNLPLSLKRLEISRCHPELWERYGDYGGYDRHKISHIPHFFIYLN